MIFWARSLTGTPLGLSTSTCGVSRDAADRR
jgi:hypothetical protein